MKKTLITAILFTVSFSSSFAQLSKSPQASFRPSEKLFTLTPKPMYGDRELAIGGHVSFMKLFSANTMIGIGVNGLFSSDGERNAYFGDISQFFGGKIVESTYATASSNQTSPTQVDVDLTSKFKATAARVGWRRYLVNDITEEGFKMYFHLQAGVMFFKGTTEASAYDATEYNLSFEPELVASGLFLGAGYGLESRIGEKASIFGDLNLTVPANNANGVAIEVEIPATLLISIGTRFTL